jgi:tRNA A-37 threonylcarbamoyl transferase component Bud32
LYANYNLNSFVVPKKVLHGDLAARNVLLADHGVLKVSDFGMARRIKEYDYQKKRRRNQINLKNITIMSRN